jgi:hypothetical protein
MAFTPPVSMTLPESAEPPKYSSGYPPEEEDRIKREKALIDARDLTLFPVTLEEFKTIVAPWFRINRTEEFILHPEKVKKERVPKVPKEKVVKERLPKEKKLTKGQVQAKLQEIIMKKAFGQEVSEEEESFYNTQYK